MLPFYVSAYCILITNISNFENGDSDSVRYLYCHPVLPQHYIRLNTQSFNIVEKRK